MPTEAIINIATGETSHVEVDPPALDAVKAHTLATLADLRWRKTQTFDYDGETDVPADPALAVVTSLVVANQFFPSTAPRTFKLKSPAVYRSWTIDDTQNYGLAIAAHIQACFDHEAALAAEIQAAADHAALGAIDIGADWP